MSRRAPPTSCSPIAIALCAAAACTPSFGPPGARRDSPSPAASSSASAARHTAPRGRRAELPRVEGEACAVAFEDSDAVLARVGDVVLTACDVAVAQALALREGQAPQPAADVLARLIDEALLAEEARRRGLDHAPATARRVRDTLAAAVVRAQAVTAVRDGVPDDEAVARYHAAHADEFATAERVHLRAVVLDTEAAARAVVRDAASAPFDELVAQRSVTPESRRDAGDLGLVPREGNDRVPRAVAAAGFALGAAGEVAPEPVRVETTELVGRRRRPQTRVRWYVVQLLARVPASVVPAEEAARRIRFRLAYGAYQAAREAARAEVLREARAAHAVALDAAALRRVRIAPAPPPPPREPARPPRHTHR